MTPSIARAARPATPGGVSPWLYAAFVLVAVLPFLLVATPPIMDFANHAARLDLACTLDDPAVRAMYRLHFGLIPNLAIDAINAPLCGRVDPSLVLRLCTTGALLLIFAGLYRLQRIVAGGVGPVLLLAPALAMNLVTTGGYINYLIGIALVITLFVTLLARPRPMWRVIVLCNVAGVVIFFCHIFAVLLAALLVFGWRMNDRPLRLGPAARAALETAAMFAAPIAAMPFVARDGGASTLSWYGKMRIFFAPFNAQVLPIGVLAVALIIPLFLVYRRYGGQIAPVLRRPLIVVFAFVLLAPGGLRDAVDIDARTAVPLAWLAIAATVVAVPQRRVMRMLIVSAALVLALHSGIALVCWPVFARQVAEAREAFAVFPAKARVLSLTRGEDPGTGSDAPVLTEVYNHLASYATRDRRIFNPLEFTGKGMQPLQSIAPYAAIDVGAAMPIPVEMAMYLATPSPVVRAYAAKHNLAYALEWRRTYDYVILYRFDDKRELDARWLTPVRRGSYFTIYRVDRSAA